ncbi:MAG TPA: DUF4337 family protein [Vicinamibacterales bacterium]|jgi:site-specific DNA-cytosine methylase
MPEEAEIDTDTVREHLHHAAPSPLLRRVALTTALLAALGAVSSLRAGDTVNEALVLKTEAGRLQAEASDQWAYYQAKGIKAQVQASAASAYEAAGKSVPPAVAAAVAKYAEDQKEIEHAAREKEHERDEASAQADQLLQRHRRFANSVAFIQVAIALGAVAALTQQRSVWFASLALGLAGLGLFAITALR